METKVEDVRPLDSNEPVIPREKEVVFDVVEEEEVKVTETITTGVTELNEPEETVTSQVIEFKYTRFQ